MSGESKIGTTCDHTVSFVEAYPTYGSYEGGYTREQSNVAEDYRDEAGERFNFCPKCGTAIDWLALEAAWKRNLEKIEAQHAERQRLKALCV